MLGQRAWEKRDIAMARAAASIFPFNRYIRTQPGYISVLTTGDVEEIAAALRGDPFSADLTFGLIRAYMARGDHFVLGGLIHNFIRLVPNSPQAKGLLNGTFSSTR